MERDRERRRRKRIRWEGREGDISLLNQGCGVDCYSEPFFSS